jgi:hypothetical protein
LVPGRERASEAGKGRDREGVRERETLEVVETERINKAERKTVQGE